MTSGGPRKPARPAPVSGPGRLSARTDGGPGQIQRDLPNASYGEAQAFAQAQQGAPLALADGALTPSAGGGMPQAGGAMPVTPFGAPTNNPGQPISAGASFGPGPGPESLGLSSDPQADDRKALVAYLPALEFMANLPTAMPSLRVLVRKIKFTNGL